MLFKRSLSHELANAAGGVFTVLFTIVIAIVMVRILGMAAGGRIDNATVLQMVIYNALTNLPPLLALSIFIAVLMTMMRSWQDNEMVVWFCSGGRSLAAWVWPILRFVLPLVIFIAALSVVISPWAKSQTEINRTKFSQRDDVNRIAPGRFIESHGGSRVFFVESVDPNGTVVGKLFLNDSSKEKESTVTASKGQIEVNEFGDRYLVLENGRRYETSAVSPATKVIEFERYLVRLDLKVDNALSSSKISALPLTVLLATNKPKHNAELLWRFSWPLAALNLALLAIPLSCSSPRAGRSLNLVLAILMFVLYLNGITIFQTWVEQGKFNFLSGIILLNGSVFLLVLIGFYRWIFHLRWFPAWLSLHHFKQTYMKGK